jgi:hypothetical protein
VSQPVELSVCCKFRDVSDVVKFASQLCDCDSLRSCLKHVDVQDLADQFVVEGFDFPFVVGGEGPRLDTPQSRVEWELDGQHSLELSCDIFRHPCVGKFLNLCLCLIDLSDIVVAVFPVFSDHFPEHSNLRVKVMRFVDCECCLFSSMGLHPSFQTLVPASVGGTLLQCSMFLRSCQCA